MEVHSKREKMIARTQPRVFISYVQENAELVDRLQRELENRGVDVWRDAKNLFPGDWWKDEIRKAIRQGDHFIACFSKEFVDKQKSFMYEELMQAVEETRQRPPSSRWLIPVFLSECTVPEIHIGGGQSLASVQHVKLFEDWRAGIRKISQTIHYSCSDDELEGLRRFLITEMKSDDAEKRMQAAKELGNIGNESVVSQLCELLFDEDDWIRWEVVKALGKIESEEAIIPLQVMLKSTDSDVRRATVEALGMIKGKNVVRPLIFALNDSDISVRWRTIRNLGELGDSRAILPLRDVFIATKGTK